MTTGGPTDDPVNSPASFGAGGDLYAKTLALLRRLFVGNGYRLEEVQISQIETADFTLPGRLDLELEVGQQMTKLLGPARGGEARVFRDRTEEQRYLGGLRESIGQGDWLGDLRALIEKSPGQGWGLEQGRWVLPHLGQRVALQMVCDLCLGQKFEKCLSCHGTRELMCQGCNGAGVAACQLCYGSGADPADRSRPCSRCQGRRQLPCPACQGHQRISCHVCRGTGQTECRECQGHGFRTEETVVTVTVRGTFALGDVGKAPSGVLAIIDRLGPQGLAHGHALIMPDRKADAAGGNALHYAATIPYGRYRLQLGAETHEITAVGMKPLLADCPTLLDDVLRPALEQLSTVSLMSLAGKYRIIRELSEALARGEKPARFFAHRYPFALSAPFAFELAGRLREVFSGASLVQRVIAAGLGVPAALVLYYFWLSEPRPAFLPPAVPVYVWDMAVPAVLALLVWVMVGWLGRQAIRRLIAAPISLRAAGGWVAHGAALALLLGSAGLLVWPIVRPEWVEMLLR